MFNLNASPAEAMSKTVYKNYASSYMKTKYGWKAKQFSCLSKLWDRESNWNPKAHNKSSGAHGIPQALPGNKMGKGWRTDANVQIRWGLKYIKGRYGTPCSALKHSNSKGWY
jgi:membrane-bound lytic murein transglycosylase MltF